MAAPATRRDADRLAVREAIARYERSLADVPGWIEYLDFLVFQLFDQIQDERGIAGDILEIGAYQGRTAILLQWFCRGDDRLSVCDVFEQPTGDERNEDERDAFYQDLTRRSFETHFLRWHPALPDVHQCRSQELEPRLRGRTFRIIHVDGGHLHAVVRSDLALAQRVVAPGGMVAVDDYRREHTPGVAAAVWAAVANDGLVPLCITPGKLYGCWGDPAPYVARLRELAREMPAFKLEEHVVAGHALLRLSDSSVQGASREEFLAVQLAELRAAHAALVDDADRTRGELHARTTDLAAAHAELDAARRDLDAARGRIADDDVAAAQQALRMDDLALRIRLLEAALGLPPR